MRPVHFRPEGPDLRLHLAHGKLCRAVACRVAHGALLHDDLGAEVALEGCARGALQGQNGRLVVAPEDDLHMACLRDALCQSLHLPTVANALARHRQGKVPSLRCVAPAQQRSACLGAVVVCTEEAVVDGNRRDRLNSSVS